jgi:hypothetical protein
MPPATLVTHCGKVRAAERRGWEALLARGGSAQRSEETTGWGALDSVGAETTAALAADKAARDFVSAEKNRRAIAAGAGFGA